MEPKAEMKRLVGASPTPRSSLAGRSAAAKLLPRKWPERSLVPTKTIGSRCIGKFSHTPGLATGLPNGEHHVPRNSLRHCTDRTAGARDSLSEPPCRTISGQPGAGLHHFAAGRF